MWDEEDGFFYDVLRLPDGRAERLKVRSMVGLLPLCAVTSFDGRAPARSIPSSPSGCAVPRSTAGSCGHSSTTRPKLGDERPATRVDPRRDEAPPRARRRCSTRRSSSALTASARCRDITPTTHTSSASAARITGSTYLPAESDTGMFGGNSNWRGPIWMPVNALIIRACCSTTATTATTFTVECPTGSGQLMTLYEVAQEIERRLTRASSCGTPRVVGPSTAGRQHSRTTRTGATTSSSTNTSTATTGPASAPVTRPDGPAVIARAMHLFETTPPERVLELRQAGTPVEA